MPSILVRAGAALCCVLAVAGCSNSNPVKAEANTLQQGLSAGASASLEGALQTAQSAVAQYRAENGADPSPAAFLALPDVAVAQRNVALTYRVTASGGCLTATTRSAPAVTRYATDTSLLPDGQSC